MGGDYTYSSKHDPEKEPPVAPGNYPAGRRIPGKLLQAKHGAQEYGQESCLQQLRLPPKRIPAHDRNISQG